MNWKTEILNHLWQSTAFAVAVGLTALLLRRNSPRLRYWLWLSASLKFLIPFSLLVTTGARIQLPPDTPSLHAVTVQQISLLFLPVATQAKPSFNWLPLLTLVWLAGALFLTARWLRHWRNVRRGVGSAAGFVPGITSPGIPIHISNQTLEPGVFGLFNPVLLLPAGLAQTLTKEQFEAILVHESRHVECHDNLTAALHMAVETIFWFHPLVWWIGARLIVERERDCDEAVLRRGSQPATYARSIVHVCQTYIESPIPCASGISGSDLRKRIREIMTWRGSLPVTKTVKAALAIAAVAAFSLPFVLGILRAQTLPKEPTLTYDAVSIHKSEGSSNRAGIGPGPQGGWRTENTSVVMLISNAYRVHEYQIIGAPAWASSQGYNVTFTPDKSEPALGTNPSLNALDASMQRNAQRMQSILRDRFGLVVRSEVRELPIYKLVQAKGGAKLSPHDPAKPGPAMNLRNGRTAEERQFMGIDMTVAHLAASIAGFLRRPVVDETHLDGQYDFTVNFTPDLEAPQADGPSGGSLFTALTDQLGLKLEPGKGPVQVYVIEKIEQPGDN